MEVGVEEFLQGIEVPMLLKDGQTPHLEEVFACRWRDIVVQLYQHGAHDLRIVAQGQAREGAAFLQAILLRLCV
mgnify:CR=1 FL=1